jgi:hypothetical protein
MPPAHAENGMCLRKPVRAGTLLAGHRTVKEGVLFQKKEPKNVCDVAFAAG